jgi:hypothetical protein
MSNFSKLRGTGAVLGKIGTQAGPIEPETAKPVQSKSAAAAASNLRESSSSPDEKDQNKTPAALTPPPSPIQDEHQQSPSRQTSSDRANGAAGFAANRGDAGAGVGTAAGI